MNLEVLMTLKSEILLGISVILHRKKKKKIRCMQMIELTLNDKTNKNRFVGEFLLLSVCFGLEVVELLSWVKRSLYTGRVMGNELLMLEGNFSYNEQLSKTNY